MSGNAAVIGSGFGGLALAIRLQSAGIATTLFEQRDKPGGRAYVFEDDGFVFDAGPTVITHPGCLEELFELSGRRLQDYVELRGVEPFYRLMWEDGTVFDYTNDDEVLEEQIGAINAPDVEGYRRFREYSEEVLEEGYIKLGAVPFLRFNDMIRVSPQLIKLQAYRSVYSMVSKYVRDEKLRQAFSFHSLLVGGNPFTTSSIYALIHALECRWGVSFPMGGTHALVRALVRLFTDIGGEMRLGTPVSEITTIDDQVTGIRTACGAHHAFDQVASNGDIVHTYERLLGATPRGRSKASWLKRTATFSPSLFVLYFGVRGNYPDLRHHTILFGQRYRELLKEIYRGKTLPDDFSLYLHAPTVTDPSLAPEGCSSFYVLSPVPNLGQAAIDWEQEGPAYQDRLIDYLEQYCMPGLRDRIVTTRIWTPNDFASELNAHVGSAFSMEPVLWQSAFFRTHNRDAKLGGMYFVGAGTHPGAGIPGVVASAKATSGLMIEDAGCG